MIVAADCKMLIAGSFLLSLTQNVPQVVACRTQQDLNRRCTCGTLHLQGRLVRQQKRSVCFDDLAGSV